MYDFEKKIRFASLVLAKVALLLIHQIEQENIIPLSFSKDSELMIKTQPSSECIYILNVPEEKYSSKLINPYISAQLVYFHYELLKYYYERQIMNK